ncbi:MAG TPA: hypothetical protein VGK73_35190 [Polyangiaceae bacterium]
MFLSAGRAGAVLLASSLLLGGCESSESLGTLHREMGGTGGMTLAEEPRLVPALSDPEARDTDPSFTEDLRELYFMSERSGNKEIWRSERPDPASEWGAPEIVPELAREGEEENPTISNDGRDIWFFTDRDRGRGSLWHASRAARGEAWSEPEPVPELTTGDGSSDVSVAVDPARILFVLNSKLTGNQPYQLYQIDRDGPDGDFSEPVLLENVVSDADEFDPDLRQGGRVLVFDSRRSGRGQIHLTTRDDAGERFRESAPLEALRSDFEDGAPALSEDLDYVMFSSDRSGNIDIYEARLVPPL